MAAKFKIGQEVLFTSNVLGRPGASGVYTVVKVLPNEHEDREYRIKSKKEIHERAALESQLKRID